LAVSIDSGFAAFRAERLCLSETLNVSRLRLGSRAWQFDQYP